MWGLGTLALVLVLALASAADAVGHGASSNRGVGASPRTGELAIPRRARKGPAAHAAIVNGTQIAIAQAPWQVVVFAAFEGKGILCGGSIISPTEVLTAAHCVFGETTHVLPAEDFEVVAGTADITPAGLENEPGVQERLVSAVRPHPYYDPAEALPAADDVAVLRLATPLVESPGVVQTIGLSPAGVGPEEGTGVNLTGFGAQDGLTQELNGRLYAISMNTTFSRRCGGQSSALYVCARTPAGSLCNGDSGGGLTLPGTPATVVGVVNTVEVIEKVPCRDNADGGFASVPAPEIRDFILGSESPPRAPRGGGGITIRGVLRVGAALTCEAGAWSNSPSFTYTFVDNANAARLQSGTTQTYLLSAADVGRKILCEVQAATAGGTGAVRTEALPEVLPAFPQPPISQEAGPVIGGPPQAATPGTAVPQTVVPPEANAGEAGRVLLQMTSVAVQTNGTAIVKLSCLGSGTCTGTLSLTAKRTIRVKGKRIVRTISIGPTRGFEIVAGGEATVTIKLAAVGRSLVASAHGRLDARLTIAQIEPAPALKTTKYVQLVQRLANRKKI